MITRRIWIRGHLATVTGDVDYADPDVGIITDSFTATNVQFEDRCELAEHEELTESEMIGIDYIYWNAKPFDSYEHMVYQNADGKHVERTWGPDPMGNWHGRNE